MDDMRKAFEDWMYDSHQVEPGEEIDYVSQTVKDKRIGFYGGYMAVRWLLTAPKAPEEGI